MRGRPSCLLQSPGGGTNRILLASALSSMRIICPKQGKSARLDYSSEFGLLRLPPYIIVPNILVPFDHFDAKQHTQSRHHWSNALILRASVLDIAQQSEPYRNIGKMHVLYSFNFNSSRDKTHNLHGGSYCTRRCCFLANRLSI